MSIETETQPVLDREAYFKRQVSLLRRAKTLPEDKLEALAREAIKRLAAKIKSERASFPSQEELLMFCNALVSSDDNAAANFILDLNARQVAPEALYLNYMASAARLLGTWWEEDRVGFWEVTVGTGRLLAIIRSMSHLFETKHKHETKSAVFAAVPGEQHVLGMHMAVDIFRKDGWNVAVKVGRGHDQLVTEIENIPTDVIGLSMGGGHSLEALSKLVIALRISCPNTPIVLSGRGVKDIQMKLAWMELDGIVEDIEEAKTLMNDIWERRYKHLS